MISLNIFGEGKHGFLITEKDFSFIINEEIIGPFPNEKSILLLFMKILEQPKSKRDKDLEMKLFKEVRKYRALRKVKDK